MTLVVADTSPVRYLILAGAIETLPKLYDSVVIPAAVRTELSHPSAPSEVRSWISKPPTWIMIQTPERVQAELNLGQGELEAIALAQELNAAIILLDDRHARETAAAKGLTVAGTLGVLEKAAIAGLLDLRLTLELLRKTNFRADEKLFVDTMARVKEQLALNKLNLLSPDEFIRIVGPVFEHSPWIAEETWPKRPFASVEQLHKALCKTVQNAGEEKQLALIRAHPDLVGKLALAGSLTKESTGEQASAGLDKLTPEEIELFQKRNAAYQEKFGFPFVICARLNQKEAILDGFKVRLHHSREQEIQTALAEIFKIAELRLRDLTHA